jgi:transposase
VSKGIYRTTRINSANEQELRELLGEHVYIGTDIAKKLQYARFAKADELGVYRTFRWEHPKETPAFFGLCERLRALGMKLEVVMEPTGTYGDPIRVGLAQRGIPVFRVNGKQVHDMAEVIDRVPSSHDPKSGALLVQLHALGASKPWGEDDDAQRRLAARVRILDRVETLYRQRLNQLEAVIARHWPELTTVLSLDRATTLALLCEYGDPAHVAQSAAQARMLMRRTGGSFLDAEKIEEVLRTAGTTCGVGMVPEERLEVRLLAKDALELREKRQKAAAEIEEATVGTVAETMHVFAGKLTAAVFVAAGVNPVRFDSPKALVKGFGLNLKEHSSGTKKGTRRISKRGDGLARRWLYWMALRRIDADPVVGAWFRAKAARDGGQKMKAVVAVMRKLCSALWHVGRGQTFDARKLFDVRRLGLEDAMAS